MWLTTASTITEVPLSAVRGTAIRPIWMSLRSAASPTPTVNTGTSAALSASSASASEASVVSAPSLTMTRPASGRPASSCRAPSSAAPSLVCEPSNASSPGAPSRRAVEENRNVRTTNLSARARITGDSAENRSRTKAPRDWPSTSAICMLRESSISTPRKFCCDTAARTTSTGRNRQKSISARVATRRAMSTTRCRPVAPRARAAR